MLDAAKAALGMPKGVDVTPFIVEQVEAETVPTADPNAHITLADDLKELARAYVAAADQAPTFAESDEWHQRAAQLRLIANLVQTSGPESQYVVIGTAWLDAGIKLLAARVDLEGDHA